ncbi:MAG: hypothetical protein QOD94_2018 [Alphaproteobacteria bacterium]|nr:hypothetical protein [Alphaproteobacteria bacterium]
MAYATGRNLALSKNHRFADLLTQVPRFIGAGAINTLATFLLYQMLLFLVPYKVAYTLSFAAGILLSAVFNSRLVFRTTLNWRALLRFTTVTLVTYVIGLNLVVVLIENLGVPPAIAPLFVVVLLLPLSFFGTRIALGTGKNGS